MRGAGLLRLLQYGPDLIRLLFGLMLEKRVWWGAKLVLLLGLVYFVVPTDVIIDFIPFAGLVDDLFIFLLAAYLFTIMVPRDVMDEHLFRLRQRNQR
jgi:uncharacterized membrane protein YkvA (DUF1232 family)